LLGPRTERDGLELYVLAQVLGEEPLRDADQRRSVGDVGLEAEPQCDRSARAAGPARAAGWACRRRATARRQDRDYGRPGRDEHSPYPWFSMSVFPTDLVDN